MKSTNIPKVSIVILNWEGREDTIECLESLYRIEYSNYEVILVDNFSQNDSLKKIKNWVNGGIGTENKYFGKTKCTHNVKIFEYSKKDIENGIYLQIKEKFDILDSNKKLYLLKNDKNYGFAGGNNMAISQILQERNSEYILLLNNDTIVEKQFLNILVDAFINDLSLGIAGPKLLNYNTDTIQSLGGNINLWTGNVTMISGGASDFVCEAKEVPYIRGAAILIKKEVFEKVGILEEKYFAYFEETDLCISAQKKSFGVKIIPNSVVWHKGMVSFNKVSGFSLYLMTRNLFWFEKKHTSRFQFMIFIMYYFCIKFPKKIIYILFITRSKNILFKYLQGLKDGILHYK